MFDIVYSSYDFGENLYAKEYQTKDIEDFYSGNLNEFWLDPSGVLWFINYSGTYTIKTGDGYRIHREKTGRNGKITPYKLTKHVTIYPSKWKENYSEWPHIIINFNEGQLIDYKIKIINYYDIDNSINRNL